MQDERCQVGHLESNGPRTRYFSPGSAVSSQCHRHGDFGRHEATGVPRQRSPRRMHARKSHPRLPAPPQWRGESSPFTSADPVARRELLSRATRNFALAAALLAMPILTAGALYEDIHCRTSSRLQRGTINLHARCSLDDSGVTSRYASNSVEALEVYVRFARTSLVRSNLWNSHILTTQ